MLSRPGSDLDTRYWKYSMEWQTGQDGYLKWYYDNVFVWGMDASSFGAYTVCEERAGVGKECHRTPERMIPNEPMSLVMNTAIGTWNGGASALDGKHWPALFYVDYVRVWQRKEEMNIGCNPPDYPTKKYIENHAEWYGEPAKPSGYDTCPEIYPASAHKTAALFAEKAKIERAKRASGAAKGGLTMATNLMASSGVSDATASPPVASQSATGMLAPLLVLAGVATAAFAAGRHRAVKAASPVPTSELEQEYQAYERYGPIN